MRGVGHPAVPPARWQPGGGSSCHATFPPISSAWRAPSQRSGGALFRVNSGTLGAEEITIHRPGATSLASQSPCAAPPICGYIQLLWVTMTSLYFGVDSGRGFLAFNFRCSRPQWPVVRGVLFLFVPILRMILRFGAGASGGDPLGCLLAAVPCPWPTPRRDPREGDAMQMRRPSGGRGADRQHGRCIVLLPPLVTRLELDPSCDERKGCMAEELQLHWLNAAGGGDLAAPGCLACAPG